MKKFVVLFIALLLFSNFVFAKTDKTSSVTHYKSGSYKITAGNRTDTYDKYGKKKSSSIKDSSGKITTAVYDKNGNKTKTTVKSPNGTTKIYDKTGKLIKTKQVTNYQYKMKKNNKKTIFIITLIFVIIFIFLFSILSKPGRIKKLKLFTESVIVNVKQNL